MQGEIDKQSQHDFEKFMKVVKHEADDVTKILRSHLFSECYLDQLIEVGLLRGDIIVDGNFTFPQKLTVVEALGVIPKEIIYSLRGLNKVRNQCAHVIDYRILENDVEKIGRPFGIDYLGIKRKSLDDNRGLLFDTLLMLMSRLCGVTAEYISRQFPEKGDEKPAKT